MTTDRIGPMGRPTSELSSEYRRRLRRIAKRSSSAEEELRATILAGIDAGEPQAAIARELGVGRDVLNYRIKAWGRVRNPGRRQAEGEDA